MNTRIFIALLATAIGCVAEIIPSTNRIAWYGNVGVSNGIPARTTIYQTFSSGATASQINTALANCPSNQVVYLNAGTYSIGTLNLGGQAGVTLRGAGTGSTIITPTARPAINVDENGFEFKNSGQAISSGYTKGSTSITLATTPNASIVAGTLLIIYQNDLSGLVFSSDGAGQNMRFTVRCLNVSGNTIAFDPPLPFDLSSGNSPKVEGMYGGPSGTVMCGIEDLTINCAGGSGNAISVWGADQFWVKNVAVTNWVDNAVQFSLSSRCEVRHCRFEGAYGFPNQSDGYGVYLWNDTSAALVEDNIFGRLFYAFWGTSSSGNARLFNYCTNSSHGGASFQEGILNSQHGAHPMMNLFEGNVGNQFQTDGYHGSSSHETLFRNWVHGLDPNTSNRKMVDILRGCYYYNVVGNVLGRNSWTNYAGFAYSMTGEPGYTEAAVIYRWGYPNVDNNDYAAGNAWPVGYGLTPYPDEQSEATALVHGNYDVYTDLHDGAGNGIVWDGDIADHTVPASLFYASKPGYFGTCPWPPFDPESPSSASVTNIPAGYRYVNGEDPPADGGGGEPATIKARVGGKAVIGGKARF